MAGRPSREETRKAREKLLRDHGEEDVEVGHEGLIKTSHGYSYISNPHKPLSEKNRMIADLLAVGMKPRAIASQFDMGAHTVRLIGKDPRVRQIIRETQKSMTEQAKDLLNESVMTAATNVVSAVDRGDLKESHFVLGQAGITDRQPSQPNAGANINLNFADWLSKGTDTKEIHAESISETRSNRVVSDATLIDDQSDGGHRL